GVAGRLLRGEVGLRPALDDGPVRGELAGVGGGRGLKAYRGFGHACSVVGVLGSWRTHLGGAGGRPQAAAGPAVHRAPTRAARKGRPLSAARAAAYLGRPAPQSFPRGASPSTERRRVDDA